MLGVRHVASSTGLNSWHNQATPNLHRHIIAKNLTASYSLQEKQEKLCIFWTQNTRYTTLTKECFTCTCMYMQCTCKLELDHVFWWLILYMLVHGFIYKNECFRWVLLSLWYSNVYMYLKHACNGVRSCKHVTHLHVYIPTCSTTVISSSWHAR